MTFPNSTGGGCRSGHGRGSLPCGRSRSVTSMFAIFSTMISHARSSRSISPLIGTADRSSSTGLFPATIERLLSRSVVSSFPRRVPIRNSRKHSSANSITSIVLRCGFCWHFSLGLTTFRAGLPRRCRRNGAHPTAEQLKISNVVGGFQIAVTKIPSLPLAEEVFDAVCSNRES